LSSMAAVEYAHTRHQVPRGARPDVVDGRDWILVKSVTHLRLTYQIRLLTFGAQQSGARLVIHVRVGCRLSRPLREFLSRFKGLVLVKKDLK
jgi:hypothetical protein